MARRRMFSLEVIDSDHFLEMPLSTQALYFHLGMRADDEGFVTPQKVMRSIGATQDDLRVLTAKGFVYVFEDGVMVILHWKDNNYIQSDRFTLSRYHDYAKKIPKPQRDVYKLDTVRIHPVPKMDTQVRLGKDRINTTPLTPRREAKELAISPEVRVLWDSWEHILGPVTRNQGFHRNALSRLLKAHGEDLCLKMIRAASAAHADRYAPKDSKPNNPKQLEEKWDALYLWAKGRATQHEVNKPVRI